MAAEIDTYDTVIEFLRFRGVLRLLARATCSIVRTYPAFWNRVIFTPRAPLMFLRRCLERSSLLSLLVVFNASGIGANAPLTFDNDLCSVSQYVVDAAAVLNLDMDRCAALSIHADNLDFLHDILEGIILSEPERLQAMDVTFRIDNYADFRPHTLHNFHFARIPPIGLPFPAFTTLAWMFASVSKPCITFITSESASCSIVNPWVEPITWQDVETVLYSSMHLATLILDNILFDSRHGEFNSTIPLDKLVELDLTFRGRYSMASLVSRLNVPCLRTLRVTITDIRDFECLSGCGSVLTVVKELVLIGTCRPSLSMYKIFSMLHAVQVIDLRLGCSDFLRELIYASSKPSPFSDVNWHACPALSTVLVHGVSISSLKRLVVNREAEGYKQLARIVISDPAGGWDDTMDNWLQDRSIAFSRMVNGLPVVH